MTEKQILRKVNDWDDVENYQAIVDFIESLPAEDRTNNVLSELGRAYNNLHWQDQSEDSQKHLHQAIRVFKYLEAEQNDNPKFHYRIGYSYFFLGDAENAKKYFLKEKALRGDEPDERGVDDYLEYIEKALEKGVSCIDVMNGGRGKIQYPLEDFLDLVQEKAPALRGILAKGASEEAITAFENEVGETLPEAFKELHRTFSGQTENVTFFATGLQYFVSLPQIKEEQKRWKAFVENHFGSDWESVMLDEETFQDDNCIKNTLFNEKWLPLLAGEDFFICVDLDPAGDIFNPSENNYGQIISVNISPEKDAFYISKLFADIEDWINYIVRSIKSEHLVFDDVLQCFAFAQRNRRGPFFYDQEERNQVLSYIEETFGKIEKIIPFPLDEGEEQPYLNVEIAVIPPSQENDYYILATCGMGSFPMYVPEDYPYTPFNELAMFLPASWDIYSEDDNDHWPILWLQRLATLPAYQGTFLGYGHTIPTGDFISGTNFDTLLLVGASYPNPENEEDNIPISVELSEEKKVDFYFVTPIYPEETQFKLDHSADELLDKFIEAEIPYPPVVDIERQNVCEGYEATETPTALDNVAWAFKGDFYSTLMQFWAEVRKYNDDIENDLEDFAPFAAIFASTKVKMIYQAYIRRKEDLHKFEELLNPDTFDEPTEDGLYYAQILAELHSDDRESFGSLNLLRLINNTLSNKELGDHIFFEGIDVETYEEDGTPVFYLMLGS